MTNYKHELANAEMTINLLLHLLNECYAGKMDALDLTIQSVLQIAKRDGRI